MKSTLSPKRARVSNLTPEERKVLRAHYLPQLAALVVAVAQDELNQPAPTPDAT